MSGNSNYSLDATDDGTEIARRDEPEHTRTTDQAAQYVMTARSF
ncbi:hypothetical protein [Bradyrhizobium jicamae]|nr:hypothetical protein [Bradyrhizobium jicamae]